MADGTDLVPLCDDCANHFRQGRAVALITGIHGGNCRVPFDPPQAVCKVHYHSRLRHANRAGLRLDIEQIPVEAKPCLTT